MTLALIVALAACIIITFLYVAATFSNALGGSSWFPRFLMCLLFIALDLVILDALNWITVN